jgi:hypothetical protein
MMMPMGYSSMWGNTWAMYDPFCMPSPFNPWRCMNRGWSAWHNPYAMGGYYGFDPYGLAYGFNPYWLSPYNYGGPQFYGNGYGNTTDNGTTTQIRRRSGEGTRGQRGGVVYNNSGSNDGGRRSTESTARESSAKSGTSPARTEGIINSRQLAPAARGVERTKAQQSAGIGVNNNNRGAQIRQSSPAIRRSVSDYTQNRRQEIQRNSSRSTYSQPSSRPAARPSTPSYGGSSRSSFGTSSPSRSTPSGGSTGGSRSGGSGRR